MIILYFSYLPLFLWRGKCTHRCSSHSHKQLAKAAIDDRPAREYGCLPLALLCSGHTESFFDCVCIHKLGDPRVDPVKDSETWHAARNSTTH